MEILEETKKRFSLFQLNRCRKMMWLGRPFDFVPPAPLPLTTKTAIVKIEKQNAPLFFSLRRSTVEQETGKSDSFVGCY